MSWQKELKAVILAAGSGERLGKPKAFLEFRRHTFIEEIYHQILAAGITKIAIVTTRIQYPPLQNLSLPNIEFIINFTPQHGQFSSIRLALIAAAERLKGVLLIPVDHPAVKAETYSALIQQWIAAGKEKIIIPAYNSQRGHPVIIPTRFFLHIINAPRETTLRNLLAEQEEHIAILNVNDQGVILNINTPQDYLRLCYLRMD